VQAGEVGICFYIRGDNPKVQTIRVYRERESGGSCCGPSIVSPSTCAELLGGDVRVVSTLGEGSTFTLTLLTGSLEGVPLVNDTVGPQALTERIGRPGGERPAERSGPARRLPSRLSPPPGEIAFRCRGAAGTPLEAHLLHSPLGNGEFY
jgi:hypothetical protein